MLLYINMQHIYKMKDKIFLYKNSVENFILDYLNTHKNVQYSNINLSDNDYIIPIITLTIISNLNKKNKRNNHGYYIAFLIKLLTHTIKNNISLIIKLMDEHLLLISSQISNEKLINIGCFAHDILFTKFENLEDVNNVITNQCIVAILFGWIFGCGTLNKDIIEELELAGKHLGVLFNLSNKFNKDDYDNQFDLFVKIKQKFIEIMVKNDIFSDTMGNIVNMLEEKIDKLME